MSTIVTRRVAMRFAAIALAAVVLAGCDKCGHRIDFVAPSIQHACGDNAGNR